MSNFFGGDFFGGGFFGDSGGGTGTGGIDPGEGVRIVKPTGILHRPKKEGRKDVSDRIEDSRLIAAEVAAKLAREFGDETEETRRQAEALAKVELDELAERQVDFEIGVLLRKKQRTDEEEVLLLLLLAASA